jgi:hypothetical protein
MIARWPKRTKGLVGAAGEYFVAAELSRRGWLATVTIKNAPGTDVLAQRLEDGHTVLVQTKTSAGYDFTLKGPKTIDALAPVADERAARHDDEWFILVTLRGDHELPDFYMVPRNVVAAMIFLGHRHWLKEGVKIGKSRKDTSMRKVKVDDVSPYRDKWDFLERSSADAPYLGPERFRRLADEYGLPASCRRRVPFGLMGQ